MVNGIGISEIVVIVFLLLLLCKPEDLPSIIRFIGRVFGKIKGYIAQAQKIFAEIAAADIDKQAKAAQPEKSKTEEA